jgi:RNA polymerase sigma factor (sigma-70 family)
MTLLVALAGACSSRYWPLGEQQLKDLSEDYARVEDREIISACLKGNQEAWEALVLRYQRLIYSIPIKARLSPDDAADIFQSVCLKLLENLSSLRDQEKIGSWLITTTSRECWRISNRQRRDGAAAIDRGDESSDPLAEIPDLSPLADEHLDRLQQQQIVRQAVAALPERCSELIKMLFYQKDECSYADIARRIGIPVSSIGPTRARCLEKLKKILAGKL